MQYDISNLTKSASKLPACSTMALEILRFSQNSEIDRPGFLRLVSSDPIITVQILKIANASLFNYSKKISSLEKALVILGFNFFRDIALSISVMSIFKDHKYQEYSHEICHHSLLTALSLKILAQNYDSDNRELLYLGGLLHDIGKLLLLYELGDEYILLLEKEKQEDKNLIELENQYLGQDHAHIGAQLTEHWNLPSSVVSMIRFHHDPELNHLLQKQIFQSQLVYLGNLIAAQLKKNHETPFNLEELDPDFANNLAISKMEYTEIINEIRKEILNQNSLLGHFQIGIS
jgi:putative nucleotidyltransferase with HDIG domain